MAKGYFVTTISPNLGRTPEGFLVAKDCVIARTGFQTYKVRDLNQQVAEDLGIDTSNPDADIDLYRPASEVFDPKTMASYEGKPVVDDHPAGREFVNPDNYRELACGHIQNIRKGWEPLESGEWPLIGDLVITTEPLISSVEDGVKRELSCGYDFNIARDGEKILQVAMVGNHVAVVPKGRAGAEARINDSADVAEQPVVRQDRAEPLSPEPTITRAAIPATSPKPIHSKEKKVAAKTLLTRIFGEGFKIYAKDADPEDVAKVAEEYAKDQLAKDTGEQDDVSPGFSEKGTDRRARDRKAADRRGRDEFPPKEEEEERADDRRSDDRADDRRAADRRTGDRRTGDRRAGDRRVGDRPVADQAANDRRARLHDTLDCIIDECMDRGTRDAEPEPEPEPELVRDRRASDTDLAELQDLLGQYYDEEQTEPEHQGDEGVPPELLEAGAQDRRNGDSSELIEADDSEIGDEEEEEEPARAADSLRDLNMMRRAIRRSGDQRAIDAFNAQIRRITRTSRPSTGSYGNFARSAAARDENNIRESLHRGARGFTTPQEVDAIYARYRGKNPKEVNVA